MANKIDLTSTTAAQLTDAGNSSDLAYLKANGARALPDSPTASQWSAAAIKRQLYKQAEILFAWLKKLAAAQLDLGNEIDEYLDDLSKSNAVPKVYATLALATTALQAGNIEEGAIVFVSAGSDLSCYYATNSGLTILGESFNTFLSRISAAEGDIDSLEGRMDSAEGRLDANDTEEATHHHLKTDGDGYIYQELPTSDGEGTSDNKLMNHADGVSIYSSLTLLKDAVVALMSLKTYEQSEIEQILAGTLAAGYAKTAQKATTDSNGDPINAASYAKNITVAYNASTGVITLNLLNQNGAIIDTKTIDLPAELCFSAVAYDADSHSFNFTTTAGSVINVPATDLVDTYVGSTGTTITVSVSNNTISAEVVDGSITLAKLASSFQTTWQGWVDAEAARVLAEQGRVSAEGQRVINENARLARPYLCYDEDDYICINYGSGRDITID